MTIIYPPSMIKRIEERRRREEIARRRSVRLPAVRVPQPEHTPLDPVFDQVAVYWGAFQQWSPRRRGLAYMTGGAAVALLVLSLVLVRLTAVGSPAATLPNAPAPRVLPVTPAAEVVHQVMVGGLALRNLEPIGSDDGFAHLQNGYRFNMLDASGRGDYVLLSYPDADSAAVQAFMLRLNTVYAGWTTSQFGNVLVLTAPTSSAALTTALMHAINRVVITPHFDL